MRIVFELMFYSHIVTMSHAIQLHPKHLERVLVSVEGKKRRVMRRWNGIENKIRQKPFGVEWSGKKCHGRDACWKTNKRSAVAKQQTNQNFSHSTVWPWVAECGSDCINYAFQCARIIRQNGWYFVTFGNRSSSTFDYCYFHNIHNITTKRWCYCAIVLLENGCSFQHTQRHKYLLCMWINYHISSEKSKSREAFTFLCNCHHSFKRGFKTANVLMK